MVSYDRQGRARDEPGLETINFQFSNKISAKLMKFSSKSDNRLHMIFTAGLAALLNKYTGNKDIIVGMPIYKQKVEGEFINTVLPLRNKLEVDMIFKELILQVRTMIFEAAEHQNYPIETLLYKLNTSLS